jgi:hypothetical protein
MHVAYQVSAFHCLSGRARRGAVRGSAYPHLDARAAAPAAAAVRRKSYVGRHWRSALASVAPKAGSPAFENGGAGTWRRRSFSPAGAHFAAPASGRARNATALKELDLIILGVILLIIGFIAKIAIVWTLGIIVLVVGAILALLGTVGHAVGGRRHYF